MEKNDALTCFAAGTLIHTRDDGLKPIEQIQVGDWVLTQPEETGERNYKRETRTTRFEDKPVWTVRYFRSAELERAKAENRMMSEGLERRLVVTTNHPLWVKDQGWVQVKDLNFDGDEFLLSDGDCARLSQVSPLYRTETDGVAWQPGIFDETDGELVDLRNGASGEFDVFIHDAYQPDSVSIWNESDYFRCTVYDFEVEDCHTYYVGTEGVWAHHTNRAVPVSANSLT